MDKKLSSEVQHCVVTTFSRAGFGQYGKRFLDTFQRMNPSLELIVVVDEEIPELIDFQGNRLTVLQNVYSNEIRNFISANMSRIGGCRGFEFQADRFVYKPAAIMTAIAHFNEGHHDEKPTFLSWIDGDTVFRSRSLLNLLKELAPNGSQIASVLDRKKSFYFLEAGLIIFNIELSATRVYIENVLSTFLSERIFDLHEWHDGFVWTLEMYKRPPGTFRLLCTEFSWQGEHPIAQNRKLAEFLDHVKGGSRKELGFSPERFGLPGYVFLKTASWVYRSFRALSRALSSN